MPLYPERSLRRNLKSAARWLSRMWLFCGQRTGDSFYLPGLRPSEKYRSGRLLYPGVFCGSHNGGYAGWAADDCWLRRPCAGRIGGAQALWTDPGGSDYKQPPGCGGIYGTDGPLHRPAHEGFDRRMPLSYCGCASERNLDRIEEELRKKGYLMKKEERL